MTTKTDNEISNLFNYDKLKELCTKTGCHMPEDALSKIADTPTFVRVYFEKIGEIQERGKHESELNELKKNIWDLSEGSLKVGNKVIDDLKKKHEVEIKELKKAIKMRWGWNEATANRFLSRFFPDYVKKSCLLNKN